VSEPDPAPQSLHKLAIRFTVGFFATARREVLTPASDDAVECLDQCRLWGRFVASYQLSELTMMCFHRRFTGFDDGLESEPGTLRWVASDIEPKEVESRVSFGGPQGMRDSGFTRFQF
jgi:hypothetical protein